MNKVNSDGCFTHFEGITAFGMLFLDKNRYLFDTFNHEFIHYYQWLTDDAIQTINVDFATLNYPLELELFFNDINSINQLLTNIVNYMEFEAYGNIFINQVKQYLPNNNLETIRNFFSEYNKTKKESNGAYLRRMYNSDLFNYLQKQNLNITPFIVFMLNEIYRLHNLYFVQHLTSIYD